MRMGEAPQTAIDWKKVDWKQKNREVAKTLKVGESWVSTQRKAFAPQTMKHTWGNGIDWSKIDWKMTNREIAVALGVKDYTVSRQRARMAPETVQKKAKPI